MKILIADYVLTCDKDFNIIKNGAVCFSDKIEDIGGKDKIIQDNPSADIQYFPPNSVIMPGLVNTHIHLEFSANKTTLLYGDFIKWLQSVIQYRDILKDNCAKECYKKAAEEMMFSGVTSFGAISSFGDDLEICFETPQKVVFFNEILGSNIEFKDDICQNFNKRIQKSLKFANDSFIPAVSVHSAYSTHPKLIEYSLDIAKQNNFLVSTHFMESQAEREWLDDKMGNFKEFLKKFNKNPKPMQTAMEFLKKFEGLNTIFVHGVLCNDKEISFISKNGSLSHCLVSNRVLNNPLLDLEKVLKFDTNITIGTDGLSSNSSLNIWDELRANFFAHMGMDTLALAKYLITFATSNGAKALNLTNSGTIQRGKSADMIVVSLPDEVVDENQIPIELILHTKKVKALYINGEKYV